MNNNIEQLAYDWVKARPEEADIKSEYYCQTRDVFQARLDKMVRNLFENTSEETAYIISAMAGEIGNNSFDHNLGSWTDLTGIFFAYEFFEGKIKIVLADRGRGVLATLKRVKPELEDDLGALKTAFTERISGRAPENRGNGLKFVKENTQDKKMHLTFISGFGKVEINEKMEIEKIDDKINGCLAILSF
jgi:hypothetical protein